MIFKTFNSNIDASISKIGMFNKSFWAMEQDLAHGHGVGYSIFGGEGFDKGDSQAILNYNNAINKGIPTSKAWAMYMEKSSIACQNVTRSTIKAKGSLVELANGLKATSIGAKAAEIGLKALSVAGNMLLSMGISWVISEIIKGFQNLANAQENAIKKADEFIGKFNEQREALVSNKKDIDSISADYAKLANGVDSLGRNISLNTEEYSRYNEIVNKIAEMFPQMVQGYTDEGNAIIRHKGNVEELTKAYQEQKKAAQDAIIVGSADVYKGFKAAIHDDSGLTAFNGTGLLQLKKLADNIVAADNDKEIKEALLHVLPGTKETLFDKVGLNKGFGGRNLGNVELVKEHIQQIRSYLNTLNTEINTEVAKIKPIMQAYLEQSFEYQGLSDDAQDIVKQIVGQFDAEFFSQFKNETEMASWITENIVNKFKGNEKMSTEFNMMFGVQTQFNNGEITVGEYQEKLEAFLELIEPLPDETEKYIKLLFGIQTDEDGNPTSDTDAIINNVKQKFEGHFDKEIGALTLPELKILADLDISWDDVEGKQDEIKKKLEGYNRKGFINFAVRPVIDTSELEKAGWGKQEPGSATVYSNTYYSEDFGLAPGRALVVTPILPNGKVLSPHALEFYAEAILEGHLIEGGADSIKMGIFEGDSYKEDADDFVNRIHELHDEYFLNPEPWNRVKEAIANTSKEVNNVTISLKDLSEVGGKLSSLSSASKELSDNGYITVKTLQDIQEATELTGDEWDEYESKLLRAKAGSSEFNQALSELTYKIIENKLESISLTNATEEEIATIEAKIVAMLREQGVTNAEEVAHEALGVARVNEAIATYDGTQASYDSATALINETLSAEQAKVALKQLELAKLNINKAKITSSDDIDNIIAIANAAGATIKTLNDLARAKSEMSRGFIGPPSPETFAIQNGTYTFQYEKLDPSDFKVGAPKYSGGSSSKGSGGSNSSEKEKKEVEEYTADIEKFAEAQQKLNDAQERGAAIEREIARERDPDRQLQLQLDRIDVYEEEQRALHNLNEERRAYLKDRVSYYQGLGFDIDYDPDTNRLVVNNMEHINEIVASTADGYDSIQEATNAFRKDVEEGLKDVAKINEESQQTSEAWEKVRESVKSISYDRLSNALKSIEKEYDDYKDRIDKANESLDKQIKREKGLQDILSKKFDAINSLNEAQHEANKSIADSRISKAYLSDTEYAKIFNEEDYQKISDTITKTNSEISRLTSNFQNQILKAYENDQTYLVEHITAEYERQVELKMKEIEIVKAELDYTKKQTELNNILSERNVKQLVERNGKFEFEWVADQEKVRSATEALADAEYSLTKLSDEKTQQMELDNFNRKIEALENIQETNNDNVKKFGETVDTVKEQVDNLKDPIASFGASVEIFQSQGVVSLGNAINDVISALAKFTGSTYDKIVVPNGKAPVQVNPDGNAPKGLSVGTVVKTNGGNYLITKVNPDGSYKSTKLTGYASGTNNATKGWHRVDEDGSETYISKLGIFHNFSGGEPVFNAEQTRRLWNLSKVNFLSTGILNSIKEGFKNTVSPAQIQPVVNNYSFGDTNITNPTDFNDFVRQFKNAIQRKTV